MAPFALYVFSISLAILLLYVFTGFRYFPEKTFNFCMHLFIFSYVVIQVAMKEIRFNSFSFNQNMSVFSWAGYLTFGFFVKLMFTAMLTTFIALFAYLYPTIFELLMRLGQNHDIQIEKQNMVNIALLLMTAGVFAPIWEEFFYRGILLRKFMNRYSTITSIILSSLLFAIFHGSLFGIVNAFILGCFFAYIYIIKQNIWIPIIIHSINNILSILLSALSPSVDPSAFEELSTYDLLLQDIIIPLLITIALTVFFFYLVIKGYRKVQSISFN